MPHSVNERPAVVACAALDWARNAHKLRFEGVAGCSNGTVVVTADVDEKQVRGQVRIGTRARFVDVAASCILQTGPHSAAAGVVQGFAMAGVGIGAIVQIVRRILEGGAPSPAVMGGVAALALAVNGYCAYRLLRFRGGDASMRAIWLSTRNDAMLNVLTVAGAVFIAFTGSGWRDILAGAIIAAVNLWGAIEVISTATREMRKTDSN